MANSRTMSIKYVTAILLSVTAASAHADCYLRSSTSAVSAQKIDRIADTRSMVSIAHNGEKICSVTFRAQVQGQWLDGAGTHNFNPDDVDESTACIVALEFGKQSLLKKIAGQKVASEQIMVCSDEPKIVEKPVQEGDIIKESMVKPHPGKPYPFQYKGSQCKWFIETDIKGQDMYQWQGVICEIRPNTWQVVTKF